MTTQNRHVVVYNDKHVKLYKIEEYKLFIQDNRLVFLRGFNPETGRFVELKFLLDRYLLEENQEQ